MPEGSGVRLFISYSHKDESPRQALGNHLAGLQQKGAIDANLKATDIILCLVSAGFLASP